MQMKKHEFATNPSTIYWSYSAVPLTNNHSNLRQRFVVTHSNQLDKKKKDNSGLLLNYLIFFFL